MSSLRKLLATVGIASVVAGPVLLITSPAGATTGSYTDPRPCSPTTDAGFCISAVDAGYTTDTVTLTMTVGQATDPLTDPLWTSDNETAAFLIGADSSTPNYLALIYNFSGQLAAGLASYPSAAPVCLSDSSAIASSYSLAANQYVISIPASCLGDPSSVEVEAQWLQQVDGATNAYASPEDAACCTVTPDGSATSTTTTSTTSTTSSTTTTTAPPTTTTSAPPAPTTTPTTQALTSAVQSVAASQLAFTGTGDGVRVMAVVGSGLILFGLVLLGTLGAPRPALALSPVGAILNRVCRRQTGRVALMSERASKTRKDATKSARGLANRILGR